MTNKQIKKLADEANMIINGYAFFNYELGYKIINLNNPVKATNISFDNEILETTMDDIEISIIKDYLKKNKKYMELDNA